MDDEERLQANCPNCGGTDMYKTEVSSGGGYAPNYLPQLGSFWGSAKFHIVVCGTCGLTQFFAPQETLEKISQASKWERLP